MSNSTPATPKRFSRLKKRFSLENFTKRFSRWSPRHQSQSSTNNCGSEENISVETESHPIQLSTEDRAKLDMELQEFEVCEMLNNGKSPGKERRVVVVMEHMGDSPKTALKSQVKTIRFGALPTVIPDGKENSH